jgi:hypothetical protein
MSQTISKSIVGSIREMIETEQKPFGIQAILFKDIRMGIKFNTLTKQKVYLETCLRTGLCPPEIVTLASRMRERNVMMRNMNVMLRNREEEKRILKMRIHNAKNEARIQKTEWEKISKRVYRETKLTVHGRTRYKNLKEKELQKSWRDLTMKYSKKIENLRTKQRPNSIDRGIPDVYKEVLVTDEALREAFGDEKPEPKIYGGIEASDNVKAFMILPANLRRYDKVDIFKEEVKAEVTATKQRWTVAETEVEGYEALTAEQKRVKIDKDKADRVSHNDKRVDFARVRATEMTHNKWITLPKPVKIRAEIKIQEQRLETIDEVKKYVKEMCDEEGTIKESENLTETELAGLKEIQHGIKTLGWMLYTTDKSNSLVLDTKVNFIECMEDHYKNDTIVDVKVIENAEKDINNSSRVWANILSIGHDINQAKRCKDTLIVDHPGVPVMQGYRKDHKAAIDGNETKGPPLRPLCAANMSLNAPLGGLMSKILKAVGDEASIETATEILSTEELCRAVEDLNKQLAVNATDTDTSQSENERRIQSDIIVIGSMDAKALYPSVLDTMAGDAAEEAVTASKLEWKNVDSKHLVRFAALKVPRDVIEERGLGDVIPKPKTKTTINSYANPRGTAKQTNGENQFAHVRHVPNSSQVKQILGMAVKSTIEQCMNSHFYQIGGNLYRQAKGGSIGSTLTGEACRVYMLKWDLLFLAKLKKLCVSILMYKRYIDDVTAVLNAINKGWTYDSNTDTMCYNDNVEDDRSPQLRTLSVLCDIANSICPQIQMTFDVPEKTFQWQTSSSGSEHVDPCRPGGEVENPPCFLQESRIVPLHDTPEVCNVRVCETKCSLPGCTAQTAKL